MTTDDTSNSKTMAQCTGVIVMYWTCPRAEYRKKKRTVNLPFCRHEGGGRQCPFQTFPCI